MSSITKISKIFPSLLQLQKHAIPYIRINTYINRQTAYQLDCLFEKIPQNKQNIALVIKSSGGCPAQTHRIVKKIDLLRKRNNATIWTFAQQFALNSAFQLLMSGDKVFIDETTVIGGVQVGQFKQINRTVLKYIENITYSNQPTLNSERAKGEQFDPSKKQQLQKIYETQSLLLEQDIRNMKKINEQVDLKNFYIGEQARKAGLVDGFGRLYETFTKEMPNHTLKQIQPSQLQKLLNKLRSNGLSD